MSVVADPVWVTRPSDFEMMVDKLGPDQRWVMDTETDGLDVRGTGKNKAYYIGLLPVGLRTAFILNRATFEKLRPVVERLLLVGHNIRFDLHALDLRPEVPPEDTMLAGYYGHTTRRLSLDHFAKANGWGKIETPDLIKQGRILEMDPQIVAEYLADDCLTTGLLYQRMEQVPHRGNLAGAEEDFRTELAVYHMEDRGVRLLEDRLERLGARIHGLANDALVDLRGAHFKGDPNSPKQVAAWLESKGRILPRTQKGNPSTSKIVLSRMADEGDNLAALLLYQRRLTKLISAFTDPLPKLARGGMLYPEVKTCRTKTGRFAYANPNLQQVPKRGGSLAKDFRRCFTGASGYVSGADYSQVELRVAAALAGEPVLLDAFASGGDPHTEVAAKMLGKSPGDVSPDERFKAKAVNFGILNGMGAPRLAIELKSSVPEARRFLDDYRRSLTRLTEWSEGVWRDAEALFLARTLSGRTRIYGPNESTRSAISVVVQGTAAELMRQALASVDEAGLRPILVVHDEVVCDVRGRGEEIAQIMQETADAAFPDELGDVSFTADAGEGETWGDI